MKKFIAAIALATTPFLTGCYDSYMVYGDSIASPKNSWVNEINAYHRLNPEAGFPYMQNNSLPGQMLMNFDLPDYLYTSNASQAVIIALGTNDAGRGVPVSEFAAHLDQIIQKAKAWPNKPLTVVCLLAYDLTTTKWNHIDTEPYRQVQRDLCPAYIDVDLELEDSGDGLHMGPIGQAKFANQILLALSKTEH